MKVIRLLIDAIRQHSVVLQTNTMGLLAMSTASDRLAASIEAFNLAATQRTTQLSGEVANLTEQLKTATAPAGVDEDTLNAMADHVDQLAQNFATSG